MTPEEALAAQLQYAEVTRNQRSAVNASPGYVDPDALIEQFKEAAERETRYQAEEDRRIDRETRGQALHAALAISGHRGGDPDAVLGDARAFYAFLKGDQQ